MYVPTWAVCLLSAVGGVLITFIGMVIAVVIQQGRKRGE